MDNIRTHRDAAKAPGFRRPVTNVALSGIALLGFLLSAGGCAPVAGDTYESYDVDDVDELDDKAGHGTCGVVGEHEFLRLSCAAGQTIRAIQYASYGTPSGSCAAGFSNSYCHAAASKPIVERACLGRQSCSVESRNSVFSDPCSGTKKLLAVVAVCSGDGPPPGSSTTQLGRPGGTKLRIASWNVLRGSVFPRSGDALSKIIHNAAEGEVRRGDAGTRVLKAVDADIWLLQETVYHSNDLPSWVTLSAIDNWLAAHMGRVTGHSWSVRCNGEGLCAMIRGGLRFAESYNPHHRVTGNRVVLHDGSTVLLVNVHYMDSGHAAETASLINSAGSLDAAVFVGGDFNDSIGGSRYNIVDSVSGMNHLSMFHTRDSNAIHLSSRVANAPAFTNTGGQVAFGEGTPGQDVVTSAGGGTIDHFFLRSNTWQGEHRYILNTFLLSPSTLGSAGLTPLDVALKPDDYRSYFRDFASRGIVYGVPSGMRGIGHDHLPMIIDFTWR